MSAVLSLTAQHARVREGLRLVRFILGNVILDTWRCGVRMMGGVKKQRADHLISQLLNVYCWFLFVCLFLFVVVDFYFCILDFFAVVVFKYYLLLLLVGCRVGWLVVFLF